MTGYSTGYAARGEEGSMKLRMNNQFCPKGKCECKNYLRRYKWRPDCCFNPEAANSFDPIDTFEICPWPSRQNLVKYKVVKGGRIRRTK